MSNSVIRITPFGGFDIPGLENWLAAMAATGLRFSTTAGPLTCFKKAAPETVQVHLEPIQGKLDEDPELNALYQEAGWHYWGMFRGNFFVFASPDPLAQAHTDPETLDYALKRFFRSKLVVGLLLALLNLLLLGLYRDGAPWKYGLSQLRYFPMEILSNGTTIPFLLAMLGLLLIDLSYLLGLVHLAHYRRAINEGHQTRGHRGAGWLLAAGLLVLLPVLINTVQLFYGLDYRPYDLEDSGFVTLTDLEGDDFRLSGDPLSNMDYISHSGTLLDPESWYFQQYGAYSHAEGGPDANDVPHLKISITRYPLEALAKRRTAEWCHQRINGSGEYEDLGPACGLDDVLYAVREDWTDESGRISQPGGILILRLKHTVLFADYYGEQNLSQHLEHFAQMMSGL